MQTETKVSEKANAKTKSANRMSDSAQADEQTVKQATPAQDRLTEGEKLLDRLAESGKKPEVKDPTRVPDMTKPIIDSSGKVSGKTTAAKKPIRPAAKRSRELSSLIGRTLRLQLKQKHIVKSVAFISNKGGVGKTHIASNMAFYLSRLGKKPLLIDLDLGNSDVTNKLGFYCDYTIIDLLKGNRAVKDIIYDTPHGFDIIGGESGNFKLANLTTPQRKRFIRVFEDIRDDYDFVLMDLSAGIGTTALDCALAQDYQVIVTTPQDIVAGYACIKAAFHRFRELEQKMAERDPDYTPRLSFRPFIVLNQVPDFQTGRSLFKRIQEVVHQNLADDSGFKLDVNFLGIVMSDGARVRESELNRTLYSSNFGATQAGQCFNFLAHNMAQYRDPNNPTFTTKLRRFVSIFLKSVGETKYAQ
ncbi:MAG: AAA family ATPase [candidate division Zixibacteria bacterium]|nr:AAA family ATPase [candidate division Zixibacteria bacterium]